MATTMDGAKKGEGDPVADDAEPGDEPEPAEESEPGDESEPAASSPANASDTGDDAAEEPRQAGEEKSETADSLAEWLAGKPLSRSAHLTLGIVVPSLIGFVTMWRLKAFTVDDAYISYRYARNLARGFGLVYNEGERIEGYTNFLWTVLLALGAKFGIDPTVAAKLLGFGCGLAALGLMFHLESLARPLRSIPAISPYLLATTTAFMGYSIFGLETALFAALVLGGIALMMREERVSGFPWSGVFFGLAGLTRPEAPMYLGLMMLFLPGERLVPTGDSERRPVLLLAGITALGAVLLVRLKEPNLPAWPNATSGLCALVAAAAVVAGLPRALLERRNLARGGLFVAIVLLHVLWRKSYYGAWVPNTLVAKTGNVQQQLAGGIDYLTRYAGHEGPLAIFAVLGVGVALARKHRHLLSFAAIGVCVIVYVALVGGDWMAMFRFATPLQPFLYLLAGAGVRELLEERSPRLNWGLFLLALGVVGYRAERLRQDRAKILHDEKAFWDRAAGGVADWFAEAAQRHSRATIAGEIALGDIGQVGYETDLPIVDLLGLVDPVVPTLPGGYTNKTGQGFRDYFFQRRPRYFVLISAQNDCSHPSVAGSIALYRDPRFRDSYSVSGRVVLTNGFSWCIYERNQSVDVAKPVLVKDGPAFVAVARSAFGAAAIPRAPLAEPTSRPPR